MAALPPFHASVAPVTVAELGASWHAGCPVGAGAASHGARVSYVGLRRTRAHGRARRQPRRHERRDGVFRRLYAPAFRSAGCSRSRATAAATTARWRPTTRRRSTAAPRSPPGPKRWSAHAYGEAIDVNTVENPYLDGGRVIPPAGRAFTDRSRAGPGWRSRAACSCVRSRRSAGSGADAGLARPTSSTSPRPEVEVPRPRGGRLARGRGRVGQTRASAIVSAPPATTPEAPRARQQPHPTRTRPVRSRHR